MTNKTYRDNELVYVQDEDDDIFVCQYHEVRDNEDYKILGSAAAKQFGHAGGVYFAVAETRPRLEGGVFQPISYNNQIALRKMTIKADDVLDLPDATMQEILDEFTLFWSRSSSLKRRGLAVKRGALLFGPPGSGKTTLINRLTKLMVEKIGGVVLYIDNPAFAMLGLQLIRDVEPERPVLVLYEDIDAIKARGEDQLLAILDGELQTGAVMHVATTNYPERLDKRLTARPGRFDRVTYIGPPSEETRAAYFQIKAGDVDAATRKGWVAASEGWSLAHLRELVVAHCELGQPWEEVVKRLNAMSNPPWAKKDEEPRGAKAIATPSL